MLLTSCSKDDSNESEFNPNSILGKWTLVSYQIANFENTGKTVDDTQKDAVRPTFEFKNDGTFTNNLFGKTTVISYSIQNSTLILDKALAFETHNSFTYTLSGTTFTLKREDAFSLGISSYTEKTTIILKRN